MNTPPPPATTATAPRERELLAKLQQVHRDHARPSVLRGEAERFSEAIRRDRTEIDRAAYKLVFIGPVGSGKSSVQAVLGNMFTPGRMQKRIDRDMNARSMMAVSSGRTTVCEVQTTSAAGLPHLSIEVVAAADPELRKELQFFLGLKLDEVAGGGVDEALDAEPIAANTDPDRRDRGNRSPSMGIRTEVARWLAHAAGFKDTYEVMRAEGEVCQIEALLSSIMGEELASECVPVTPAAPSLTQRQRAAIVDAATRHFLDRMNLGARQRTRWTWGTDDAAARAEFRATFASVNAGEERDAPFPQRIDLKMPELLPELSDELGRPVSITFVDTRGLDDNLDGRPDLQAHVAAADAIPVLLSGFNDTPSDVMHPLKSLASRADTNPAVRNRLLVLVLDKGDASKVLGADRNGEAQRATTGRNIRRNHAATQLQISGFPELAKIEAPKLLFFSPAATLRLLTDPKCSELDGDEADDRPAFIQAVADVIKQGQRAAMTSLPQRLEQAETFLKSLNDTSLTHWKEETKRRLEEAFDRALTTAAQGAELERLSEPFLRELDSCPYWLRIRACATNDGSWHALHAPNLIANGGYRLASRLTTSALGAVRKAGADILALMDPDLSAARIGFVTSWVEEMGDRLETRNREMEGNLRAEVAEALDGEASWRNARALSGKGYCARVRAVVRAGTQANRYSSLSEYVQELIDEDLLEDSAEEQDGSDREPTTGSGWEALLAERLPAGWKWYDKDADEVGFALPTFNHEVVRLSMDADGFTGHLRSRVSVGEDSRLAVELIEQNLDSEPDEDGWFDVEWSVTDTEGFEVFLTDILTEWS